MLEQRKTLSAWNKVNLLTHYCHSNGCNMVPLGVAEAEFEGLIGHSITLMVDWVSGMMDKAILQVLTVHGITAFKMIG